MLGQERVRSSLIADVHQDLFTIRIKVCLISVSDDRHNIGSRLCIQTNTKTALRYANLSQNACDRVSSPKCFFFFQNILCLRKLFSLRFVVPF